MGEVDRVDDTAISTKFMHMYFLPLVPDCSFLVYTPAGAKVPVALPIPAVPRSVVAGYLSRWGMVGAVLFGLGSLFYALRRLGVIDEGGVETPIHPVVGLGVTLAMCALAALLGKLSLRAKAQRRVYAAWIGPAVDPCLCGENLDPWVDRVRGFVAARARDLEAPSYRSTGDARGEWFAAALVCDDPALLGAAFTLARAEMRTADGPDRAKLRDTHEKLWGRLESRAAEAAAVPGLSLTAGVTPRPASGA
jgi:hypothetical protein